MYFSVIRLVLEEWKAIIQVNDQCFNRKVKGIFHIPILTLRITNGYFEDSKEYHLRNPEFT